MAASAVKAAGLPKWSLCSPPTFTERAPIPTKVPTKTLAEVEMPGATGEIGDDERDHHAEYGRGYAVEQLHDDQQLRSVTDANQNAANWQCGEADEQ